jgi:hypothetical protein
MEMGPDIARYKRATHRNIIAVKLFFGEASVFGFIAVQWDILLFMRRHECQWILNPYHIGRTIL